MLWQVLGAMELLMSAFPAGAPGVLEAPLQRLLAALLAGSETGQVIAGMTVHLRNGLCCRVIGILRCICTLTRSFEQALHVKANATSMHPGSRVSAHCLSVCRLSLIDAPFRNSKQSNLYRKHQTHVRSRMRHLCAPAGGTRLARPGACVLPASAAAAACRGRRRQPAQWRRAAGPIRVSGPGRRRAGRRAAGVCGPVAEQARRMRTIQHPLFPWDLAKCKQ